MFLRGGGVSWDVEYFVSDFSMGNSYRKYIK